MAKEQIKQAESKESKASATAETPAAQPDPFALSIGDLKNLSTILDVASKRGAFGAGEMSTVGMLYNKLQGFLARVAPADKTAAPMAAPTTEEKK
tara:strand:+ start:159 stop:443 length:285 start_codon:yes stop_codon:yes gene_type:complete